MGWFSDAVFGKKKRIDQEKIQDFQQPYEDMVSEVEDWSRDFMDEDSLLNRSKRIQFENSMRDNLAVTQRSLQDTGAMTNMSPAQIMANQLKADNQFSGQMGGNWGSFMDNQWNKGYGLFSNVMNMKKGIGDRLSNAHIQEINAHNAAISQRKGNFMSLLEMGIGALAGMGKNKPQRNDGTNDDGTNNADE